MKPILGSGMSSMSRGGGKGCSARLKWPKSATLGKRCVRGWWSRCEASSLGEVVNTRSARRLSSASATSIALRGMPGCALMSSTAW